MSYKFNKFSKSNPVFVNLPRNERADAVFKLKHDIARGKYRNFSSHDVMTHGVSWADVYFIGRDRFTLWNATLQTTANYKDEYYWSLAWDQVYNALTKEEHDSRPNPFKDGIILANGHKQLVFNEEPKFDKFEGRTFQEQMAHVIASLDEPIYERIEIDKSYCYGIGLHVTIDAPLLTAPLIEEFIDSFNTVENPVSYVGTKPAVHANAVVYASNAIDLGD
jgi:hypothetical protein